MTWDDFKSLVDEKLRQDGKSGNIEIDYIDMTGWEADRLDTSIPKMIR